MNYLPEENHIFVSDAILAVKVVFGGMVFNGILLFVFIVY